MSISPGSKGERATASSPIRKAAKFLAAFEELEVFQRAYKASLVIHRLSKTFPKDEQYGGLADQMRRASKSICANLAEGFAKRHVSAAECKRFLMMSYGSTEEMRLWLMYCKDLNFVTEDVGAKLAQEYDEIGKMLFTLHKYWGKG